MFAFSALGLGFVLLSRSGNRILVVYSILLRAMEPKAHVAEKDKKSHKWRCREMPTNHKSEGLHQSRGLVTNNLSTRRAWLS